MKKLCLLIVLAFTSSLLGQPTTTAPATLPGSQPASQTGAVELRIHVKAHDVLMGEPISVVKQLRNTSDRQLVINDWIDMRLSIDDVPIHTGGRGENPEDPPDPVTVLNPHETRVSCIPLEMLLGVRGWLKPGKFTLKYELDSRAVAKVDNDPFTGERYETRREVSCWVGQASSTTETIVIRQPEKEDDKAAFAIVSQRTSPAGFYWVPGKPAQWKEVLAKYPNSRYAQYCQYTRAMVSDPDIMTYAVKNYQELLDKYPSCQCCDLAALGVARGYLFQHRHEPETEWKDRGIAMLKEVMQKYPDGDGALRAKYLLQRLRQLNSPPATQPATGQATAKPLRPVDATPIYKDGMSTIYVND